jgi:hypothetical protein
MALRAAGWFLPRTCIGGVLFGEDLEGGHRTG